jgi:hypothetical protein
MSWEVIGGIAAGLAEAKRRSEQDRDLKEYREAAKDLYKAQAESYRNRRNRPGVEAGGDPVMRDRSYKNPMSMMGVEEEKKAAGGMVGAADSEISDWYCGGMSSDLWQKQSFKK